MATASAPRAECKSVTARPGRQAALLRFSCGMEHGLYIISSLSYVYIAP